MRRTFCEAMDQEPAMTLVMLEELGYTTTYEGKLARIRQDMEMYGLTEMELAERLNSDDEDES